MQRLACALAAFSPSHSAAPLAAAEAKEAMAEAQQVYGATFEQPAAEVAAE